MKKIPVCYKLHPTIIEMIKEESKKQGRSMAYVIEEAIKQYKEAKHVAS